MVSQIKRINIGCIGSVNWNLVIAKQLFLHWPRIVKYSRKVGNTRLHIRTGRRPVFPAKLTKYAFSPYHDQY
jgi:hypothetical protein